jgi:hypothetical protein
MTTLFVAAVEANAGFDVLNDLVPAVVGVLLGAILTAMLVAATDVRRNNQQVRERDGELEEWLVARERERQQRLRKLHEDNRVKTGDRSEGLRRKQLAAVNTIALYEYRAEKRRAEAFRLQLEAEEGWQHQLLPKFRRSNLPGLNTPQRAQPLINEWLKPTDGNALTWSLDDIVAELPAPTMP